MSDNKITNFIKELSTLDCGDNSCYFAKNKTGMRTNGGCRCLSNCDTKDKINILKLYKKYKDKLDVLG